MPAPTFTDMFKSVKEEAIERMKASQENIKEIETKIQEALDAGDSENFELHKLSKESNLRTLDAHKTLVLELNEKLQQGGDDRELPTPTSVHGLNPSDIEITLAGRSGGKPVKLTVKTDMHGLLRHRPFYGFEKTDPEIKAQEELDILQAATGFVLKGFVQTYPVNDLAKRFKTDFEGKKIERTGDDNPLTCKTIRKSKDKIVITCQHKDAQSMTIAIPETSTIVMDRDRQHVWYTEEPITNDRTAQFVHLLSVT